jgi:hypothetical protein
MGAGGGKGKEGGKGKVRGTHCLRGDNVVSLFLVEPRYTLNDHVVAFCRARGEDDVLFLCSEEVCYVL